MSALKLTYFPFGGRALPIRVCLGASGLAFEDERLKRPEIDALKATGALPLGQVPALFVDGKAYCQSTALARFAAKKAGLYPTVAVAVCCADDLDALLVDEVIASLDEVWSKLPFVAPDLKVAREAWVTLAAKWFVYFEARLAESGGPFFLGKDLSVADLFVYVMVDGLKSGNFDHIPADFVDAYPLVSAFHSAVKAHPLVVAHGA